MAKLRRTKKFVKSFIDVRTWMGIDIIMQNAKSLWHSTRESFKIQPPEESESFEQAQSRLNISNSQADKIAMHYGRLSLMFLLLTGMMMVYGGYMVMHGSWLSFPMAVAISGITSVMAFRYHFWRFQILRRCLGCSLQTWFYQGVLGQKTPSSSGK